MKLHRTSLVVSIFAAFVLLVIPATAAADSGGATVRTLPESEELQVSVEVQHECASEKYCGWYGEATAYSASVECPSAFDLSHGVSVEPGEVKTEGGTGSWTFAFNPSGLASEVVVCLYIYSGGEESLVGQSHPFNRATGREVLPQLPQEPGPPPRYPTRTSVSVSVRHCEVWPHIAVNGKKNVGGDIAWAIYQVGRHNHLTRLGGGRGPVASPFEPGEYNTGTYRFSARFLGDENLLPSRSSASATFHIKHC
jgi:hypothetical protein